MPRPFIEFFHSQDLDWSDDPSRPGDPGVRTKVLSRDAETGASTRLVRFAPNWTAPAGEWCAVDEEIFVLDGGLTCNGAAFRVHGYGYWPAGYVRRSLEVGEAGATLILCQTGRPAYATGPAPTYDPAALVLHLDPFTLEWDRTGMDPNIAHLQAYRKNLRLGPNDSGRTYLLGGLPQGFPASGLEPLERHPHVEEMFMVSGDMPCSLGVMRTGAYFWRPPGIWHGADCTVSGFLMFMRTPGTNRTISEWAETGHPVRLDPPYRPELPPGLAAIARPPRPADPY